MATAEQILELGDDQLKDQFLLRLPSGMPGGGNATNISLRMEETFDPPEESVNVYEYFHKGQKIVVAGGAEETEKSLEFIVRLDQKWEVYDDLKKWKNKVYNADTGTPGVGAESRASIVIEATGRETDVVMKSIEFTKCQLIKLDIQEFDHATGEPMKLNLGFNFLRMNVL